MPCCQVAVTALDYGLDWVIILTDYVMYAKSVRTIAIIVSHGLCKSVLFDFFLRHLIPHLNETVTNHIKAQETNYDQISSIQFS